MLPLLQTGLDFYQAQMVGTLPAGVGRRLLLSSGDDVTSYRGNAFTYETGAALNKGFGEVTGGWCTGDEVGEASFLHLFGDDWPNVQISIQGKSS